MTGTLWVDGGDALRHDPDLFFPDGITEGMQLAVDVAQADLVMVDEGQGADATAGQGLHRPGPDPADADDADVHGAQVGDGGGAVQAFDAAEAFRVVGCAHGWGK